MYTWLSRVMLLVFTFQIFAPQSAQAQSSPKETDLEVSVRTLVEAARQRTPLSSAKTPDELDALYEQQFNQLADLYDTLDVNDDIEAYATLSKVVELMHALATEYRPRYAQSHLPKNLSTQDIVGQVQKTMSSRDSSYYEQQSNYSAKQGTMADPFIEHKIGQLAQSLKEQSIDLEDAVEMMDPLFPLIRPFFPSSDEHWWGPEHTFSTDKNGQISATQSKNWLDSEKGIPDAFSTQVLSALGTDIISHTIDALLVGSIPKDDLAFWTDFLPRLQARAAYRYYHLPDILANLNEGNIMAKGSLRILLYKIHLLYGKLGLKDPLTTEYSRTTVTGNEMAVRPTKAAYQKYLAQSFRPEKGVTSLEKQLTLEQFQAKFTYYVPEGNPIPDGFEKSSSTPVTNTTSNEKDNSADFFADFYNQFINEYSTLKSNKKAKPGEAEYAYLDLLIQYMVTYSLLIGHTDILEWVSNDLDEKPKSNTPSKLLVDNYTLLETTFVTTVATLKEYYLSPRTITKTKELLFKLAGPGNGTATRILALGAAGLLNKAGTPQKEGSQIIPPVNRAFAFDDESRFTLTKYAADFYKDFNPLYNYTENYSQEAKDVLAGKDLQNRAPSTTEVIEHNANYTRLTLPLQDYGLDSEQMVVMQDGLAAIIANLLPVPAPKRVWRQEESRYRPDTSDKTYRVTGDEFEEAEQIKNAVGWPEPHKVYHFAKESDYDLAKPIFLYDSKEGIVSLYLHNPLNRYQQSLEIARHVGKILFETIFWLTVGEIIFSAIIRGFQLVRGMVAMVPAGYRAARMTERSMKLAGRSAKEIRHAKIGRFSSKLRQGRHYAVSLSTRGTMTGVTINTTTRMEQVAAPFQKTVIKNTEKAIKKAEKHIRDLEKQASKSTAEKAKQIEQQIKNAKEEVEAWKNELKTYREALQERAPLTAEEQANIVRQRQAHFTQQAEKLNRRTDELVEQAENYAKNLTERAERLSSKADELEAEIKNARQAMKNMDPSSAEFKEMEQLIQKTEKSMKNYRQTAQSWRQAATSPKKLNSQVEELYNQANQARQVAVEAQQEAATLGEQAERLLAKGGTGKPVYTDPVTRAGYKYTSPFARSNMQGARNWFQRKFINSPLNQPVNSSWQITQQLPGFQVSEININAAKYGLEYANPGSWRNVVDNARFWRAFQSEGGALEYLNPFKRFKMRYEGAVYNSVDQIFRPDRAEKYFTFFDAEGNSISFAEFQNRLAELSKARITIKDATERAAQESYYDILGISRDADRATIKKAYRTKSLEFHPDKNMMDPLAELKQQQVNEAYAALYNNKWNLPGISSRAQYDAILGEPLSNLPDPEQFVSFMTPKKRFASGKVPLGFDPATDPKTLAFRFNTMEDMYTPINQRVAQFLQQSHQTSSLGRPLVTNILQPGRFFPTFAFWGLMDLTTDRWIFNWQTKRLNNRATQQMEDEQQRNYPNYEWQLRDLGYNVSKEPADDETKVVPSATNLLSSVTAARSTLDDRFGSTYGLLWPTTYPPLLWSDLLTGQDRVALSIQAISINKEHLLTSRDWNKEQKEMTDFLASHRKELDICRRANTSGQYTQEIKAVEESLNEIEKQFQAIANDSTLTLAAKQSKYAEFSSRLGTELIPELSNRWKSLGQKWQVNEQKSFNQEAEYLLAFIASERNSAPPNDTDFLETLDKQEQSLRQLMSSKDSYDKKVKKWEQTSFDTKRDLGSRRLENYRQQYQELLKTATDSKLRKLYTADLRELDNLETSLKLLKSNSEFDKWSFDYQVTLLRQDGKEQELAWELAMNAALYEMNVENAQLIQNFLVEQREQLALLDRIANSTADMQYKQNWLAKWKYCNEQDNNNPYGQQPLMDLLKEDLAFLNSDPATRQQWVETQKTAFSRILGKGMTVEEYAFLSQEMQKLDNVTNWDDNQCAYLLDLQDVTLGLAELPIAPLTAKESAYWAKHQTATLLKSKMETYRKYLAKFGSQATDELEQLYTQAQENLEKTGKDKTLSADQKQIKYYDLRREFHTACEDLYQKYASPSPKKEEKKNKEQENEEEELYPDVISPTSTILH